MNILSSKIEDEGIKIIPDDEEITNPVPIGSGFDFITYSDTLSSIITNTMDGSMVGGYSIGIYGEWGYGKTTLMKLIEKKLKPIQFHWEVFNSDPKLTDRIISKEVKDALRRKIGKDQLDRIDGDQIFTKSSNYTITMGNSKNEKISIMLNSTDPLKVKHAELEIGGKPHKINGKEYFVASYDKDNKLTITENNGISAVWFNAWRYESEENYALIPLMKTMAYAIERHPYFSDLSEKIKKAISIIGKDVIRKYALTYFMTEKGITDLEKLQDRFDQSVEFDKNMVYFDGMKRIQDEMNTILGEHNDARIVIFIDDLDRCSPEHALEVFESIKVFLNIRGFIFILGLSIETLNKLIETRYQKLGLSGITGDQYIRKIIQVEVKIPEWTNTGIDCLISDVILNRISKKHSSSLSEKTNKELISMTVEKNPREVKRFFNKLAVIIESRPPEEQEKDIKIYLVLEALRKNWRSFYNYYIENFKEGSFITEVEKLTKMTSEQIKDHILKIQSSESNKKIDERASYARIWLNIGAEFTDDKLWSFVLNHLPMLKSPDIIERYRSLDKISNVPLANPSSTPDMDLRSRRRDAYKELWPRFKLLFSENKDPDITYGGRSYKKDYKGMREFSEKLQNWYYDLSGGMLMSNNSKEAFFASRTYIQSILARNAEQPKQNENAEDKTLPPEELEGVRKRARELQASLFKDISLGQ